MNLSSSSDEAPIATLTNLRRNTLPKKVATNYDESEGSDTS